MLLVILSMPALMHTELSSDSVYDTGHLNTDRPVALSGPLSRDEVELDEVVCTHPQTTQAPSVSTRCGRAIRHPNRLICAMSGQRFVEYTEPALVSAFGTIAANVNMSICV